MRAIWTGAIGFGLVNIPVKMYSATQSSTLDLDMLDKKDHSNIKFQRVNEKTGKEVAWENIVRGYKYNGEYVVLLANPTPVIRNLHHIPPALLGYIYRNIPRPL